MGRTAYLLYSSKKMRLTGSVIDIDVTGTVMHKFLLIILLACAVPTMAAEVVNDHYFTSRDGLRLHYLEAGSGEQAIVFIPGWLMPASIFRLQLEALSSKYRVLAFDPRSQGKSEVFHGKHSVERRLADMEDFLHAAHVGRYVLAGWSLGVLESLDFIERNPQPGLVGLMLIDNSIGEANPPKPRSDGFFDSMRDDDRRKNYLTRFGRSIFSRPPPEDIAVAVQDSMLQAPGHAAIQLVSQPYQRTYWRDIVAKQRVPVLYAITPHLQEQGEALLSRKGSMAQVELFSEAGHALFVDAPERFNAMADAFAQRCFAMPPQQPGAAQSASNAR